MHPNGDGPLSRFARTVSKGADMTTTFRTGRTALAVSLAVLAASIPPLRFAVLDWILGAGLVPGMAMTDGVEGLSADVSAFSPASASRGWTQVQIGR